MPLLLGPALAALLVNLAVPQGSPAYADDLVAKAKVRGLASEPEWLKLGHYRPALLGGYESLANAKTFFLARRGQKDPEAELEATLRGFFAADSPDPKVLHPQCRFPARLLWLSGQLQLDPRKLPVEACPGFVAFWERLQARSATLVFSSYYLNNPSSAFGHTFLRINKAAGPVGGKHFELLDYGVDYSATVDEHNAVLYAFKGLFGLFAGQFNHYPYFYKVREYNDYESRDLWEYELNLTPAELTMLVAHLWELGSTTLPYYYATKNCSYEIISALEVANPAWDLVSRLRYVVIPGDTVKVLFTVPGLVRSVHYRPSIRSQFRAQLRGLGGEEKDAVRALTKEPGAQLPPSMSKESTAHVLDAALDGVDFLHAKELVDAGESAASKTKQALMVRRSELGIPSPPLEVPVPQVRPDEAHGSMRGMLGGGFSSESGAFSELGFRLALHDLNDPPRGYPDLASLEFLPTVLRINERAHHLWLEDFSLVRIASLNDMDAFDSHISWKIRVGANTVRDRGCPECLEAILEGGSGVAKRFWGGHVTLLATLDGELGYSPKLQGLAGSSLRPGVGPTGVVRLSFGERFTAMFQADGRYFPFSHPNTRYALTASPRVHLHRLVSVGLDARKVPLGYEASAVVLAYF